MTITALHLIQAAELLKEIASGEADTDIRRSLVRVAGSLRMVPNLVGVADYMSDYAHGTVDHSLASMHLGTLHTVASSVTLPASAA